MLMPSQGMRILVATKPVDFRKGHDGLAALAQSMLAEDPFTGTIFVFRSKRADRLKILFWDGTGLWVACKRLEEGRFSWPKPSRAGQTRLALTPEALAMLTDGIELRGARLRPWYEREENKESSETIERQ